MSVNGIVFATHTQKNAEIIILFRWFWLRKGFTRIDCFHFKPAQQSIKTVENYENICRKIKTKKKCFMKREARKHDSSDFFLI